MFTRQGGVYTNAVSFVSASFSMGLQLLFTRHRYRLRLLPKPCRYEAAAKSGATTTTRFHLSFKRQNCIDLNAVTILARNLHYSIEYGEFSAR